MMDRRGNLVQQKPKMITSRDRRVREIMDARVKDKQAHEFFNTLWSEGPKGKKRLITEVLPNGAWRNKRCFIVAGGPSLEGFNYSLLDDELVIAINRAYEDLPNAPIMLFRDNPFYQEIRRGGYGPTARQKLSDFRGMKVYHDLANDPIDDVFYVRSLGRKGISFKLEDGLYHGNNSGFSAMALALALGANPIYLLGYDMKFKGAKSHCHTGHFSKGHKKPFREGMMKSFPLTFGKVAGELTRQGWRIYNTNKESKLRCFPFRDLPKDLSKKKRPIFVSFYTRNTGYINEVRKLRDTFWQYSLRNYIQEVENKGDWVLNVGHKPFFIKEMMERYPDNPIVWVDVDAVIKQDPVLFNDLKEDFACHFRQKVHRTQHNSPDGELLSGTLYFKNNNESRKLVDMWCAEQKKASQMWDQQTLRRAWDKWSNVTDKVGHTTYKLPVSYCQIFDGKDGDRKEAVILHFQKSREYKKCV